MKSMLPPVRIEFGTSDYKSDTLLSELTCHLRCKSETFRSLLCHALLILGESSKFK